MAKLLGAKLGQCSDTAWADLTGEHKHKVFPSRKLMATNSSREESVLPFLRCWLSLRVKKVFNASYILGCNESFFIMWNEIFNASDQSLAPSFTLLIIYWSEALSKNMTQKQNSTFLFKSCTKQQIQVDNLPEKRESAKIQIEQHTEHSNFRWQCTLAKAWKRCLA